jgi:hypothetical protein
MKAAVCALLMVMVATPLWAGLLDEGQDRRDIPFTVMDGKPMLPVAVDGRAGVMMFDIGTPSAVFFNRGAADLPAGQEVGRGFAASGQEIVVQLHPAPGLTLAGQGMDLPERVQSGDFGFAEVAFGKDFLGFVGLPAVQDHAVLLDYDRSALSVIRVDEAGLMAVNAPAATDVIATVDFLLFPDELPLAVARIGEMPVQVSFDSGDSGTLYLQPGTRARMIAAGSLATGANGLWELAGVTLGGALLPPTPVTLIEAGGEGDKRGSGQPDELRLGAAFFAAQPTLWNFPARRMLILRPGAALLGAE